MAKLKLKIRIPLMSNQPQLLPPPSDSHLEAALSPHNHKGPLEMCAGIWGCQNDSG